MKRPNVLILYPDQMRADVLARLDAMLARHLERTGDDWGIEAKFPPPAFQAHADGARYAEELAKRAVVEAWCVWVAGLEIASAFPGRIPSAGVS